MRALLFIFVVAVLSGCVTTARYTFSADTISSPSTNKSVPMWNVAITAEMAKAFSPDAAKAVLIAIAAVEECAKQYGCDRPDILDIRPEKNNKGWSVFVGFVGYWDDGKSGPMPGNFNSVQIDENWNVISIVGGA
jgi:hypothetical protein